MDINIIYLFLLMVSGGAIASYICCAVERDKSLTFDRSKCNFCNKKLSLKELLPIISYLTLKGKCKCRKKNIPYKYLYFEIFLTFLLPLYYFISIQLNPYAKSIEVVSIILLAYLFYLDWEKMLIDMKVLLLLFLLTLLKYFIVGLSYTEFFLNYSTALFLGFIFLFIISFLYKQVKNVEGMGSGDPYLAGVLGFILGINLILPVIVFGSILGICYHFFSMRKKAFNLQKKVPFGSFLILSAIIINIFDILLLPNFTFTF